MLNMLTDVICQQFEKAPGRNQQNPWEKKPDVCQALLIPFNASIDYDNEDGFRHVDILLYALTNYVQVWMRKRWDVIKLEDMEDAGGDDDEMVPKKGKDYTKGSSEWELVTDHDSCWRDGIRNILDKNRKDISGFDNISGEWYKIIPVPKELAELYDSARKKKGWSI